MPDSQLQTNAFFDTSVDTALFTTNSSGSTYAAANRNRILADTIPAVTLPIGANPVPSLNSSGRNFNMQASYENGWPQARLTSGEKDNNWYHSDYEVVAYTYTHGLFDDLVTLGSLK